MKRLLTFCGLAALLLVPAAFASSASTPSVQVLGQQITKASVHSMTVTLAAGAQPGDLVVVAVASMVGLGPNTTGLLAVDGFVTDSRGNTYKVVGPARAYAYGGREAEYVAVLSSGLQPGDTLTFTFYDQWSPTIAGSVGVQVVDMGAHAGALSDANRNVNSDGSTAPDEAGGITAPAGSVVFALVDVRTYVSDKFSNDQDTAGGDGWHLLPVVGTSGGSASKNLTFHVAYKFPTIDAVQEFNPVIGSRPWEASIIALG